MSIQTVINLLMLIMLSFLNCNYIFKKGFLYFYVFFINCIVLSVCILRIFIFIVNRDFYNFKLIHTIVKSNNIMLIYLGAQKSYMIYC